MAAALCGGLLLRFLPVLFWDLSQYQLTPGEYLMTTPDAYAWLSGSVDFGRYVHHPMAETLRLAAPYFQDSVSRAAFWLPPLASSPIAVLVAAYAWSMGLRLGAVFAGLLAVCAPNFYLRTHVGYYDTDLVTLLFPLTASLLCALGMGRLLAPLPCSMASFKKLTRVSEACEANRQPRLLYDWTLLYLAGLVLGQGIHWHVRLEIFSTVFVYGVMALALLLTEPGRRGRTAWGAAVLCLASHHGEFGRWLGLGLVIFAAVLPSWTQALAKRWWSGVIVLIVVAFFMDAPQPFSTIFTIYYNKYFALLNTAYAGEPLVGVGGHPAVGRDINESQVYGVWQYATLFHMWAWPAILGYAGYVVLLFRRPQALFLLPLAAMGAAGAFMGMRLAMFGAPVASLGLVWLCFMAAGVLTRRLKKPGVWRSTATALFCAVFLVGAAAPLASLSPPPPALAPYHAKALMTLQDKGSPRSMVWTWWDFGYATNYYARMRSFTDGGNRQHGAYLVPAGIALGSDSTVQSAQIMKLADKRNFEPWHNWRKYTRKKLDSLLASLNKPNKKMRSKTEQFLVISMEFIPRLPWIHYYASWSYARQDGDQAEIIDFLDAVQFSSATGEIFFETGKRLPVKSLNALDLTGSRSAAYPDNQGYHLLVNMASGQRFLLDDAAYNTQVVQLMLQPAESFKENPYFSLAYEDDPFIRIFELK